MLRSVPDVVRTTRGEIKAVFQHVLLASLSFTTRTHDRPGIFADFADSCMASGGINTLYRCTGVVDEGRTNWCCSKGLNNTSCWNDPDVQPFIKLIDSRCRYPMVLQSGQAQRHWCKKPGDKYKYWDTNQRHIFSFDKLSGKIRHSK